MRTICGALKWRQQGMRVASICKPAFLTKQRFEQGDWRGLMDPGPTIAIEYKPSQIQVIPPNIQFWRLISRRSGLRKRKLKPLPGKRRISYYRAPNYFVDPADIARNPGSYVYVDELPLQTQRLFHRRGHV